MSYLLSLAFSDLFISYVVIASILLFSRSYFRRYHSKGIMAVKSQNYQDAIDNFKLSYDYLKRQSWIEKLDFITLLNTSKYKYSEMALMNIAFSYTQLGDKLGAVAWYEKVIKDFPDNGTAVAALRMLNL